MPFGKARESTRSSAMSGPVSENSRVPWPTTTGQTSRVISSTSWLSRSQRTRLPLPCTCSSPAGLAFSSPMAAAMSPERTVVSAPLRIGECGRCDVLGPRVQRHRDRVVALICPPRAGSPGAGEDLVGPPAEQERVGALEDLVHNRRGLVVEERYGPSAALESAPAVLIRRAEPLHHSVDGDVRGGRQLHGRGSLLVGSVIVRLDR